MIGDSYKSTKPDEFIIHGKISGFGYGSLASVDWNLHSNVPDEIQNKHGEQEKHDENFR